MLKFIFGTITALFFILACGQFSKKSLLSSTQLRETQFDSSTHNRFCWKTNYEPSSCLVNMIHLPEGFFRSQVRKGSFEDWLRHLPLKADNENVKLFNGSLKGRQDVHAAIIDIDAGGNEDLQQCADACMRLRAEYLYSIGDYKNIHFKFTSGHTASWDKWREGYRPVIKGNEVNWIKKSSADSSYKNFKSYLKTVFRYCGTYSLNKEMKTIPKDSMRIGDVFIKGGFPGHAVMVMDMAVNKTSGEKIFIISQSYMPAQDIHILKNFNDSSLSPWYLLNFSGVLETPEWTFEEGSLKRFR